MTWNGIDPSEYATANVITVKGKVDGYGSGVYAIITVTGPSDSSAYIDALYPVAITTTVGVAPNLPSQETVFLSDGTWKGVAIAWDSVTPSAYASAGIILVKGTLSGSALNAYATILVGDDISHIANGISVIEPVSVVTSVGTAPKLPVTVTAMRTTCAKDYAVSWDSIALSQYASTGIFTVPGKLAGTPAGYDISTTATVIERIMRIVSKASSLFLTLQVWDFRPTYPTRLRQI